MKDEGQRYRLTSEEAAPGQMALAGREQGTLSSTTSAHGRLGAKHFSGVRRRADRRLDSGERQSRAQASCDSLGEACQRSRQHSLRQRRIPEYGHRIQARSPAQGCAAISRGRTREEMGAGMPRRTQSLPPLSGSSPTSSASYGALAPLHHRSFA